MRAAYAAARQPTQTGSPKVNEPINETHKPVDQHPDVPNDEMLYEKYPSIRILCPFKERTGIDTHCDLDYGIDDCSSIIDMYVNSVVLVAHLMECSSFNATGHPTAETNWWLPLTVRIMPSLLSVLSCCSPQLLDPFVFRFVPTAIGGRRHQLSLHRVCTRSKL